MGLTTITAGLALGLIGLEIAEATGSKIVLYLFAVLMLLFD